MSDEKPKREPVWVRALAVDAYTLAGAVVLAEKKLRAAAAKYEQELTALAHNEYEEARAILQEHVAKVEAFLKRL